MAALTERPNIPQRPLPGGMELALGSGNSERGTLLPTGLKVEGDLTLSGSLKGAGALSGWW